MNVIQMPTNIIRIPNNKIIYVKKISNDRLKKLLELGFTVVLR